MIPDLTIGSLFGDYRLDAIAGRGGMGVVFRATEVALSRTVALKVIASDLAQDLDFRRRFERELSFVVSLEHPNVVPVYRAGEVDQVLYIAMRFIRGIDMRALLARHGRLVPDDAARVITQIGMALDEAHGMGLVHRDVKPANVIIDNRGSAQHVYLTDFGLSKHVTSTGALTQPGVWVGTPNYIAPEQILGIPVDARADVYSLACLLFEALSGQVPYQKENEMATLFAHVQEEPPSILRVAPDVPRRLEEVFTRGMAKSPEDRFPSAGDLALATVAAILERPVARRERAVAQGRAALSDAHLQMPPPGDTSMDTVETRLEAPRPLAARSPADHGPDEKMDTIVPAQHPHARPGSEPVSREQRTDGETTVTPPADDGRTAAGPAPERHETVISRQPQTNPRGEGTSPPREEGPIGPAPPAEDSAPRPRERGPQVGNGAAPPVPRPGRRGRLLAIAAVILSLAGAGAAVAILGSGGEESGKSGGGASVAGGDGGSGGNGGVITTDVGRGPTDVAIGSGLAWIANSGDGTISRLDLETGKARGAAIRVEGASDRLAISGDLVLALDTSAGVLRSLDPDSGQTIEDPWRFTADDVAAGFESAWLVNGVTRTLRRIDVTREALPQAIPIGNLPISVAVGESLVYVVNSDSGTVSRVDPGTNKEIDTVSVGKGATDVSAAGDTAWVANPSTGRVVRIDGAAGQPKTTAITVRGAESIAAGDSSVWVTGDGSVTRIDPKRNKPGTPRRLPSGGAVAVSDDAAWVVNPDDNTVTRLAD